MKFHLFFVVFLLLSGGLFAQTASDSSQNISPKSNIVSDSLFSHSKKINHKIDSISSLPGSIVHAADSLKPNLARYNRKLDSVKRKLTHRIDSLKKLNLSTAHYTHVLDSIEKAGPLKDIKQAEARLTALERDATKPLTELNGSVSKIESSVNSKLNLINNQAGAGANLPGTNLPGLQIPGASPGTIPNTDPNLPGTSLPGTSNPLGQANLPGSTNIPGANSLGKTSGELNNIAGTPQKEINQMKKDIPLGQLQNEMNQANGYSKDLKQISKGNLDSVKVINQAAEKKAMELANKNMGQFQGETKQLDQYKGMLGKGNDPDAMKKLATQEIQKQAIDHFSGKEKELQAAMGQLSKLKQKYSSISSLSDLKKLRRNQMHGKPLIERIVPGFNLQFQVRNHLLIDFNQQLGYRITKRLTAGAGWNERTGFKSRHFTNGDRIFGPRSFVEFKITDGFSVRTDLEKMNAYVPSLSSPNDPGGRQWVWGFFLGIKKDYKFSKYIRGNIQTMYNFLDKNYRASPYADRLNVRIGFEFPMTKRIRQLAN